MFEIIVSHRARKGAKSLPPDLKKKVIEVLNTLENEPVPVEKYDVKKLKGLPNIYRIRIGVWRIIYSVEFKNRRITILKIERRKRLTNRRTVLYATNK